MSIQHNHLLQISNPEYLHEQAIAIAQYLPDADSYVTAIYELMINGIEHGNLGIGFTTKGLLIRNGEWRQEIQRRLLLPENISKHIDIRLSKNGRYHCLTISDQGTGFTWENYVGHPANHKRPHGRGLWLAFNSPFDEIQFNPIGNEVSCIVRR